MAFPDSSDTTSAAPSAPASGSPPTSTGGEGGGAPSTESSDFDKLFAGVEEGLGFDEKSLEEDAADRTEDDPDAPPAKVSDGKAPPPSAEPTATDPKQVEQAGAAPDTWKPDAAAEWAKIPPKAREEIQRREAAMVEGFRQTEGARRVQETLGKILMPYAPTMQKFGVDPYKHVSTLLNSHAQLLFGTPEQKVQIVREAAEAAGVDLAAVISGQGPAVNPVIEGLQRQVRELMASQHMVATTLTKESSAKLEKELWTFANDTEAHPFFWDVAADMAQIAQKEPNITVDKAYEQAVWSNPTVRQKAIDAQTSKKLAEDNRKKAEVAAKARKVTAGNVRSQATGRGAAPATQNFDQDLTDTIAESLSEIRQRDAA